MRPFWLTVAGGSFDRTEVCLRMISLSDEMFLMIVTEKSISEQLMELLVPCSIMAVPLPATDRGGCFDIGGRENTFAAHARSEAFASKSETESSVAAALELPRSGVRLCHFSLVSKNGWQRFLRADFGVHPSPCSGPCVPRYKTQSRTPCVARPLRSEV